MKITESKLMTCGLWVALAVVAGCQPERERLEVDTGAIPAADDMRPGTEAAPGGVALPGTEAGAGPTGQGPAATGGPAETSEFVTGADPGAGVGAATGAGAAGAPGTGAGGTPAASDTI